MILSNTVDPLPPGGQDACHKVPTLSLTRTKTTNNLEKGEGGGSNEKHDHSKWRGVRIPQFHCIQEVSPFQGVGIKGFHCIQRCFGLPSSSLIINFTCPCIFMRVTVLLRLHITNWSLDLGKGWTELIVTSL